MPALTLRAHPSLKTRLQARLRAVDVLCLSEKELVRLMETVETDPLFLRLLHPERPGEKAIRFQPIVRGSRLASGFYEFKDEQFFSSENPDVESLVAAHREAAEIARRIGIENFERYFLLAEEPLSGGGITERLGLSQEEFRKIQRMVLSLSVQAEFFHPSSLPAQSGIRYNPVVRFHMEPGGSFVILWLRPYLARGRYRVDPDALQRFREKAAPQEKPNLNELLHRLELINMRHDTLGRILESILTFQSRYLKTENECDLAPLSVRSLAAKLSISPSTASRALSFRSALLPSGEEKPLIHFFPTRPRVILSRIQTLMEQRDEKDPISDETLAGLLRQTYRWSVPRRTINYTRRKVSQRGRP